MHDAKHFTLTLGGRWYQAYGTAACPVCQPEKRADQTALTIGQGSNGHLLLHCKKSNCSFRSIMRASLSNEQLNLRLTSQIAQRIETYSDVHARKAKFAEAIWRRSQPIQSSLAEIYLRKRGICCDLPTSIRFLFRCKHPTSGDLPAMVAKIDCATGFGIHRTFLTRDGLAKAAVIPTKAMLGRAAGGAVHLLEGGEGILVAEGIETALSLYTIAAEQNLSVWAALSTSGMTQLVLPNCPRQLIVATDGDHAGKTAGLALARRADQLGWKVSMLPAPNGKDWNDVLCSKRGAQ
ncbi:hypothetical protein E7681_14225 [Thalassobius vesicularis]|uniref:Uncharacterized protein n=1 Tax=Thalassobius vesicularis TaxID=1294297 RepID=A0A4S3M945_9RHOB|nr:toprim domain-containing protein [Thalassobius vesicularis]THD72581.1 hypothetical protein E7681_14225 [Thalassobius vesicularis]